MKTVNQLTLLALMATLLPVAANAAEAWDCTISQNRPERSFSGVWKVEGGNLAAPPCCSDQIRISVLTPIIKNTDDFLIAMGEGYRSSHRVSLITIDKRALTIKEITASFRGDYEEHQSGTCTNSSAGGD